MIEILEFIFQSFWHWLGTVILIAAIPVPFGSTRTLLRIKGKRHEKSKTDKKGALWEYIE